MTSFMTSSLPTAQVLGRVSPGPSAGRSPDLVQLTDIRVQGGPQLPANAEVLVEILKNTNLMVPQAHFYGTRAVGRVVLPSGRHMTAADVGAVRGQLLRNLRLRLCQANGAPLPAPLPQWGPTGTAVYVPVEVEAFEALVPGRRVHLVPTVPTDARYGVVSERERLECPKGVTVEVLALHPSLPAASGRRRRNVVLGILLTKLVGATPLCREVGRAVPTELARGRSDAALPGTVSDAILVLPPHALWDGHDFELAGVGAVRAERPDAAGRWWVRRLLPQTPRGSLRPPPAR